MKKPFFSIIIPALNEEKYLPKLLDDLVAQTFQDFEVIVVDGQSIDQTLAKIKPFAKKLLSLKILTSPKRHVCTQRNLGAKSAKSEILIFCDADNRLPPYFLQGLKYRWESTKSDILSFWLKPDLSTPKNDAIATAINTFLELQNNLKPTYLLESMFSIRQSCFRKIGGFNETIDYAEGKSLVQSASALGYKSTIYRDPVYTFSFRRFRKYGVLNLAGRVAKMELSELLGPDFHAWQAQKIYPMNGGSFFKNKPKKIKNKFIKNIQKILKDF
ncbi:MAG: glycosyltransferase [Microgenomates group bacterium]